MENYIEVNPFTALKKLLTCGEVNVRNTSKPLEILNSFLPFIHMKLRLTILGRLGEENKIKRKEINYEYH